MDDLSRLQSQVQRSREAKGLSRLPQGATGCYRKHCRATAWLCSCAKGWNSGCGACGGCGGCGGFRPGPRSKQILPSPLNLTSRYFTHVERHIYDVTFSSRKTDELQVKRIANEGLGCMKFQHEQIGHLEENLACTSLMIFVDLGPLN